ncbi:MAG TPA: terminase family protein [Verrucomicrobiota bacterium]|nr:terminase family protein [Verrucomicrobiota bacterium]
MSVQLWERYFAAGRRAGCPKDQMQRFERADVVLQERQLVASAAARGCDSPDGPTAIGYGGARGGGKSHWLLAQMGVDDCQRVPGLKCLLLRKVGKANLEHFEDLRRKLFPDLGHEFSAFRGILTFNNGSRIIAGHFQNEKDIDAYLGLEYDVIGIEEATTLTARKYQDITTCCRTSKPNWRPRIYSTTNPGGVGHAWYRTRFVAPMLERRETETRFVSARVTDNRWNNPEYIRVLQGLSGWQRRAWLDGNWDIAAGQFFTTLRREVHVVEDFDDSRAREWFCAMDYGFAHYTVVLLGCTDGDGSLFVVDEHAERLWLPQRHAPAIKAMLARHKIGDRKLEISDLKRFVAGADVFSRQSDGTTVAAQYAKHGITLRPANTDRLNGWAEIMTRFGDVEANIRPTLFIHQRCGRLIETLPTLQHDPNRPEDVLKVDADDDGVGGDDCADCLRYLVATKTRTVTQRKLRGL